MWGRDWVEREDREGHEEERYAEGAEGAEDAEGEMRVGRVMFLPAPRGEVARRLRRDGGVSLCWGWLVNS